MVTILSKPTLLSFWHAKYPNHSVNVAVEVTVVVVSVVVAVVDVVSVVVPVVDVVPVVVPVVVVVGVVVVGDVVGEVVGVVTVQSSKPPRAYASTIEFMMFATSSHISTGAVNPAPMHSTRVEASSASSASAGNGP